VAADCIDNAAAFHRVNVAVLRAIAAKESNFNRLAVGRNVNASVDVGMFQINSIHFSDLANYGISPSALLDPCINAYVGAWIYARQVQAFGNTWYAVGAYHSRNPALGAPYARDIYRIVQAQGAQ
jgi:soluble lytic murein transglycosylase-like protein